METPAHQSSLCYRNKTNENLDSCRNLREKTVIHVHASVAPVRQFYARVEWKRSRCVTFF